MDSMLGFAAGVMMTAASFWSLLAPGIEMVEQPAQLPPDFLLLDWLWDSRSVLQHPVISLYRNIACLQCAFNLR